MRCGSRLRPLYRSRPFLPLERLLTGKGKAGTFSPGYPVKTPGSIGAAGVADWASCQAAVLHHARRAGLWGHCAGYVSLCEDQALSLRVVAASLCPCSAEGRGLQVCSPPCFAQSFGLGLMALLL